MCIAGCSNPNPPSGDKGKAGSAVQSCPTSVPKTCADAPAKIKLPDDLNKAMKDGYSNSFPGGKSQENGGTITQDSSGTIKVVNSGTGTTGTFSPNRTVPSGQTIIGTYHSHPYDASEGSHKGVSFSGADINYARYYKEPIYVDAGDAQYMVMPTQETPAGDISGDWNTEYAAELAKGKALPEASKAASNTIAKKYKMAYYEGKDGELKRVSC